MPNLQTILSKTLQITAPDADTKRVLDDLQANIVKGHGRNHTAHLFLTFSGGNQAALSAAFKKLAKRVTSASVQAAEAIKAKNGQLSAPVFCLFLTKAGYQALGVAPAKHPGDLAFAEGMAARGNKNLTGTVGVGRLNDPKIAAWEKQLGGGASPKKIHAMLMIADDVKLADRKAEEAATGTARSQKRDANNAAAKAKVNALVNAIIADLAGTPIKIEGVDLGHAYKMKVGGKDTGIENFGYVDGRSQPLFNNEEVAGEAQVNWNATFAPSQFIMKDPGSPAAFACGSYFVFRKLEQNVSGFKKREGELATALKMKNTVAKPNERERAGAMVVGRFRNGAPLVLAGDAANTSVLNDFDFSGAKSGKCPFSAHIRKTNPRGDIRRQGLDTNDVAERKHIMARRGITYGARVQDAEGVFVGSPASGVGLLFMAYMTNIREQFEFTQADWANNEKFVSGLKAGSEKPGIDPVIGQGKSVLTPEVLWTDNYSTPANQARFSFADFVKLRGGEYYFAPSVSFLNSI
jgi:Dyp-type peroxidase family